MIWNGAEKIANALLYEGYLLYPYRGSALKNRFRWQFGVVAPRAYTELGGSEPWLMQTELLFEPGARPVLDLKVRFLQLQTRVVERLVGLPDQWEVVDSLTLDDRELVTWEEAVPHEMMLRYVPLSDPCLEYVHPFEVAGGHEVEVVHDMTGKTVARMVRERWPVFCEVAVSVADTGAFRKLSVRIKNVTPWPSGTRPVRTEALRRSLLSTHTLLSISGGAFLSMLGPPPEAKASAADCRNLHTWPVLIGEPPARSLMLSSPIILDDYPSVATESPGDLFDATEIDEISDRGSARWAPVL